MNKVGGYLVTSIIGAVVGSLLTLIIAPGIMPQVSNSTNQNSEIRVTGGNVETVYKAVAKKSMPSVVGITTTSVSKDFFFGATEQEGVGTGVIVDERGYILTNSHVIDDGNAKTISVLFYDGNKEKGKVLWYDKNLDLAVVKVEKTGLPVAELGDSDKVEVGDLAIAIGNPLGLEFQRSMSQGIVSGLNRSVEVDQFTSIEGLIQTDASINPGNSGGPLLNSKGQVIGINTVKVKSAEGLGFSIPINIAKPIVDQFIEKGKFERVYLGIKGVPLEYYEQRTGSETDLDNGIFVVSVEENSAAQKAGVKPEDVIVEIEGKEVKSMGTIVRELYKLSPGDEAKVKVWRNGKILELKAKF